MLFTATFGVLIFIISIYIVDIGEAQLTSDPEKLLNWCIDGKRHKSQPGPESSLYGQCTPWKNRSCCTEETAKAIHEVSLYSFNFDHCSDKKPLSSACRRHFMQDHCFYECSPNVGPWTVKESRSWRKERYYKVPICASDCLAWFKDCKEDYTCTDNWSKNFQWIKGSKDICENGNNCKTNICPSGAHCQTFAQIYQEPKNFCEKVWDHAWEYTDDTQPCMRIWFDGNLSNPNDQVAEWKASTISSSNYVRPLISYLLVCFAFRTFFFYFYF